jgi:enterochelin esterase family protein
MVLVTCTSILQGQSFQSFIDRVNALGTVVEKVAAVDSFMAANPELPYILDSTATFIYRGAAASLSVTGDFNQWNLNELTMLSETNLWYWSRDFERDARLDYEFVLNGMHIQDPNNPHIQEYSLTEYYSVLAMPDYIWPWEVEVYDDVPAGSIEKISVSSSQTNKRYDVSVYLPSGYDPGRGTGYPTVYFNDGNLYELFPQLLDNLIDSMLIPEILAVYVTPTDRDVEYYGADRTKYRLFFVNELIPFVDSVYHTIPDASSRTVIGLSASGNIGALIGFHHPDVVGNVGLQSAAFIYNNSETYTLILSSPKKEIKWAAIWGSYDLPFITADMRNFRDALLDKGYEFYWSELHEGHSFGLFKSTADDILINLLSPATTFYYDDEPVQTTFTIYPNPAAGDITITLSSSKIESIVLDLLDLHGRLIAGIHYDLPMGKNDLLVKTDDLAPGIYLIRFKFGGAIYLRKFVKI